jgi:CRP-like cAMP-binding protein
MFLLEKKEEIAFQNELLRKILSLSDNPHQLLPEFRVVPLTVNQVLYEQGDRVDYVYFPLDSVASRLAIIEDGTTVETSMVGREGLVGISRVLGDETSRDWVWVTIGGRAIQLESRSLDKLFLQYEPALKVLLAYYRSLIHQTAQRCVCNTKHSILERLSCWLLMVHDRMGGTNLNLTQELIASRIGVRRAGITVAARVLLEMKAVVYRRGHFQIADREALMEVACECYSAMQADFSELRPISIPPPPKF